MIVNSCCTVGGPPSPLPGMYVSAARAAGAPPRPLRSNDKKKLRLWSIEIRPKIFLSLNV